MPSTKEPSFEKKSLVFNYYVKLRLFYIQMSIVILGAFVPIAVALARYFDFTVDLTAGYVVFVIAIGLGGFFVLNYFALRYKSILDDMLRDWGMSEEQLLAKKEKHGAKKHLSENEHRENLFAMYDEFTMYVVTVTAGMVGAIVAVLVGFALIIGTNMYMLSSFMLEISLIAILVISVKELGIVKQKQSDIGKELGIPQTRKKYGLV